MNFLSHYAIYTDRDDPNFTVGKVLPDMLRAAVPKAHLREEAIEKQWEENVKSVAEGVNVHLRTDHIFHESTFFKERMATLKHKLKVLNLPSIQRFRFFYAHILTELLLDRWLMQDNPLMIDRFYNHLRLAEKETISQFLQYKGLGETTKTVLSFIQRFTGTAYLYSYRDREGIVYALNRITQRVGLTVFSKNDARTLIHSLPSWEAELRPGYLTIFSHIEKSLNQ